MMIGGINIKIKSPNKKMIINMLFVIAVFASMGLIKPWVRYPMEIRPRMFYDFKDFGEELENSNEQISQILKINIYDKEKQIINPQIVLNFYRSNMSVQRISKGKGYDDYVTMYLSASKVIKDILADDLISPSEKKYLESLYSYNDELIKECKSIIGTAYEDFDFDKLKELEKNIVKIYNNYSKKSEELLYTEKYRFMKDYTGDFSSKHFSKVSFEDAKKYCNELFSKLIKNRSLLEENNSGKNVAEYVFKTNLLSTTSVIGSGPSDKPSYQVGFNRKTNEVLLSATSFTIENIRHTEQELDNTAKEIISKFSDGTFRYSKKVNYEKATQIRNIEYSYIEEINGVYDEMKKIEIHLERQGIISKFKIVYPYDEKIIVPTISKEDILKKLEKGSEVIEVLTIRNIEGKTEYEVHLKHNNAVYAAIFDGHTGELKYYGREIRNYKVQ
jgi:hypothetical protein